MSSILYSHDDFLKLIFKNLIKELNGCIVKIQKLVMTMFETFHSHWNKWFLMANTSTTLLA
jgi:hypothetical protein